MKAGRDLYGRTTDKRSDKYPTTYADGNQHLIPRPHRGA
jgi:hypothetical protein